jgi:Ca-activated chloride channel family protein
MKTTARLAHESLRFDQPASTHLVVSLTAPPVDAAARRPPVCVIPVIDTSGSMQGEKLYRAKQSVLKLVDHLAPGDRCGAVAFSTAVRVVSPAIALTPAAKAELKLRLGDLEATAQTNLCGGMLEGLGLANAPGLPEDMLVRVILFTDGLANQGLATTSDRLLPLLDAHRGRATLSAFGYGHDADQELLSDLARRGGGNYAFVETPDDALGAFGRELGGLLTTWATGIEVRVVPAPGARVASVLSDVDSAVEAGAVVLTVDDLLAEEERHLVLEVELAARADPATVPAFQVDGRFTVATGGAARAGAFAHAVQVDRVEPPLAQARPDPELDRIVAQAQLLRAQLDAEALARRGDYAGATTTLYQRAVDLEARGHAAEAAAARDLSGTMRDQGAFLRSSAHRKSVQAGLQRSATSELDADARALLDRMGKKYRTRAQEDMASSFGSQAPSRDGEPGAPPRAPPGPARPGGPKGDSKGDPGSGPARRRSRRW